MSLAKQYYLSLAAAFVRGRLNCDPALSDEAAFQYGQRTGLRLHKFKRTSGLQRVEKVLGALHGLSPTSVLDVGSGRGAFLWPLLDRFPALQVVAVERLQQRAADIQAVHRGGIDRLYGLLMDATQLGFQSAAFDVVTLLEVLEHIPSPGEAIAEAARVARRFLIISVPSREDDNPEHIHLFTPDSLQTLLAGAGINKVTFTFVLNHMLAVARLR